MFDVGKVKLTNYEASFGYYPSERYLQIDFIYNFREGIEEFVFLDSFEPSNFFKDCKLNPDDLVTLDILLEYPLDLDGNLDSANIKFWCALYSKGYDDPIGTATKAEPNILKQLSKIGLDRVISDISKLREIEIV